MLRRSSPRASRRGALVLGAALALATLAPSSLRAQAYRPGRLLFVAIDGEYVRLSARDASPQNGPGVGVEAGLVLRSWLGAFVAVDAAHLTVKQGEIIDGVDAAALGLADRTTLRHVEVGVRLRLPHESRVSPYAEVGYAARHLRYQSSYRVGGLSSSPLGYLEVNASGGAPLFGLGLESDLSNSIAFDLGARYTAGKPDQATLKVDGESSGGLDTSTPQPTWRVLRLRAGLRWYPTFGRATR